jgi:phage N-6-adenine-methyltransferase
MNTEVMFSSKNMYWETPQDKYDMWDDEFHFTTDLAANAENSKCREYIGEGIDSLTCDWHSYKGWLWLNPPYGRGIGKWVKKAYDEHLKGACIVMLLPSRTGTKWFQNYVWNQPDVTIRFLAGRLKFGDSKNSAPFDSLLAIFDGSGNYD